MSCSSFTNIFKPTSGLSMTCVFTSRLFLYIFLYCYHCNLTFTPILIVRDGQVCCLSPVAHPHERRRIAGVRRLVLVSVIKQFKAIIFAACWVSGLRHKLSRSPFSWLSVHLAVASTTFSPGARAASFFLIGAMKELTEMYYASILLLIFLFFSFFGCVCFTKSWLNFLCGKTMQYKRKAWNITEAKWKKKKL